jgi:hypothetical protein
VTVSVAAVQASPAPAEPEPSSISPTATSPPDALSPDFNAAAADPGGAIYSPFGTVIRDSPALPKEASAKAGPFGQPGSESAGDLGATIVTAGITAALLACLVRLLLTV